MGGTYESHTIVISDDTHYSRAARDYEQAPKQWMSVFAMVNTPVDECQHRAIATGQPDLVEVIREMAKRYAVVMPEEGLLFEEWRDAVY